MTEIIAAASALDTRIQGPNLRSIYPTNESSENPLTRAVRSSVITTRISTSDRTALANATNLRTTDKYVKFPSEQEENNDINVASGSGNTCVICLEKAPICVAMPCMHVAYCVACARSMSLRENGRPKRHGTVKCAKCRQSVDKFARVYLE